MRGYKRLQARFFGIDSAPPVMAYDAAVNYKLDQIAKAVSRGGVDAKLIRRGLNVQVVAGQTGRKLDREKLLKQGYSERFIAKIDEA